MISGMFILGCGGQFDKQRRALRPRSRFIKSRHAVASTVPTGELEDWRGNEIADLWAKGDRNELWGDARYAPTLLRPGVRSGGYLMTDGQAVRLWARARQ